MHTCRWPVQYCFAIMWRAQCARRSKSFFIISVICSVFLQVPAAGSAADVHLGAVLEQHAAAASGPGQQQQQQQQLENAVNSISTANFSSESAVDHNAEDMIEWIQEHGGQVNVVVRHSPGGGRATFAPRDFKQGDVLASIPLSLCYRAADINYEVRHSAAGKFWSDMWDTSSPYQPYFKALPLRHEVWSFHRIPAAYFPLIQNTPTESSIADNHAKLQEHWQLHGQQLQAQLGPDTSMEDVRYATTLLLTRLFQFDAEGLRLVPLLDMANHRNNCNNSHIKEPCNATTADGDSQCIVWRAGTDIAAGAEVCNGYKYMLNDRSLLQYGFLQSGYVSQLLSGIDRHDFNPSLPWEDLPAGENGPLRFEGTLPQARAELARLQQLQENLTQGDTAAANIPPDLAHDPDGYFLSQLLLWRQQRQAAVAAEIERVGRMIRRLEAAETKQQQQQRRQEDAYGALVTWLEQQGSQVNVAVKQSAAPTVAGSSAACDSSSGGDSALQSGQAAAAAAAAGCLNPPTSGVFTKSAVSEGDVLAMLPLSLARNISDGNDGLMASAIQLMMDIHRAQLGNTDSSSSSSDSWSFWRPWFEVLPALGNLHSMYNVPHEYLPLIQEPAVEDQILAAQTLMVRAWDKARPDIEALDDSLTLQEMKHALALVSARMLAYDVGLMVIPLLSMTNQQLNNNCPHADFLDKCPNSSGISDDLCIYWVAGSALQAGEEVCISYGYLLPDMALLQFGFLHHQPEGASPELSAMDRHDFDPNSPFAPVASGYQPPPQFSGTQQQALSEVVRLAVKHANLTSPTAAAAVAALRPVPGDPGGRMLAQLHAWREGRIAAIEAEIGRLMEVYRISNELIIQEVERAQLAGDTVATAGVAGGAEPADPWQRMIYWMGQNGAEVNVEVHYAGPSAGHALHTTSHMRRGDVLAAIPLDLVFSQVIHGGNDSLELAAANLWSMMREPSAPLAPYLASLPSRKEVLCPLLTLPEQYLPLLQSDVAEGAVLGQQQRLLQFWEEHMEDLTSEVPGMTVEDLVYARSLLSTRLFGHKLLGSVLIPLLDMANHRRDCPHIQHYGPCPSDESRECLFWRAGVYLSPGQEVCNIYKYMTNDRSMMQYGFLQADAADDLQHLDRHDFSSTTGYWTAYEAEKHGPAPFNGTLEETQTEHTRLTALAAHLAAGDVAAAATRPAPTDRDGKLLTMLLEWRKQRQAGVVREISRLQQQVEVLAAQQAPAVKQATMADPFPNLIAWLSQNGAQVSNLVVKPSAGGGRSLFTTAQVGSGDMLAVIPLSLSVPVYTENLLEDAPRLWKDMHHSLSPRSPYWRTLPLRDNVFSYYNLPMEYVPLLQHKPTEDYLTNLRADLHRFAADNEVPLAQSNMTLDDVLHVMSLVATRAVQFELQGAHLLPLIDMANHRAGCSHKLSVNWCPPAESGAPAQDVHNSNTQACSSSSSSSSSSSEAGHDCAATGASRAATDSSRGWCVYMRAGHDLAAGDEVCLAYGHLLPDRALLQYGFLLASPTTTSSSSSSSSMLSGMDRHDMPGPDGLPWTYRLDDDKPPPPFTGTPDEVRAEIARLSQLLHSLADQAAAAAAVGPAPGDSQGALLAMLQSWRQQRQKAIAAEINRLEAGLGSAAA